MWQQNTPAVVIPAQAGHAVKLLRYPEKKLDAGSCPA